MNAIRLTSYVAAICGMIFSWSAFAQDRGTVSGKDIMEQPLVPAPESGDIIIKFGESARVYFKYPVKAVVIEDKSMVRAEPQTDHVILFTGLAPGQSKVTIESKGGESDSWGLVTIVREPHEVRIYRPAQTNSHTGELRQDSTNNIGGYLSLRCNEIKCDEAAPQK